MGVNFCRSSAIVSQCMMHALVFQAAQSVNRICLQKISASSVKDEGEIDRAANLNLCCHWLLLSGTEENRACGLPLTSVNSTLQFFAPLSNGWPSFSVVHINPSLSKTESLKWRQLWEISVTRLDQSPGRTANFEINVSVLFYNTTSYQDFQACFHSITTQ